MNTAIENEQNFYWRLEDKIWLPRYLSRWCKVIIISISITVKVDFRLCWGCFNNDPSWKLKKRKGNIFVEPGWSCYLTDSQAGRISAVKFFWGVNHIYSTQALCLKYTSLDRIIMICINICSPTSPIQIF